MPRGVVREAIGAKPPPGPVKSIDFRGFSGAEPFPPWKEKNVSPTWTNS